MSGPLLDCYIYKRNCKLETIDAFLKTFLPQSELCWDLNELADEILDCPKDKVIETLYRIGSFEYEITLRNTLKCSPYFGLLFFPKLGEVIFGLSPLPYDDNDRIKSEGEKWLKMMDEVIKGDLGYFTFEAPPEIDFNEFERLDILKSIEN